MDKEDMMYIYNEIYWPMERKKNLSFAPAWMLLKDIMPTLITQAQSDKSYTIHKYVESKRVELIEAEKRVVTPKGLLTYWSKI